MTENQEPQQPKDQVLQDAAPAGGASENVSSPSGSPAAVAAPATDGGNPSPAGELDYDQMLYERALRELEAAGNPAATATEQSQHAEQTTPQQPEDAAQTPAEGAQPAEGAPARSGRVVPVEALSAARRRAQDAEQRAAYLEGVIDTLRNGAGLPAPNGQASAPGQQPAAPAAPPSTSEQLQALRAELAKIEDDYENGEIDRTARLTRTQEVSDKIISLHVEQGVSKAVEAFAQRTPPPAVSMVDEEVMAQQLSQLEGAHPYSTKMSRDDLMTIQEIALRELAREGKKVTNDTRGTMVLRERVAKLTDIYGPQWYPNLKVAQPTPAAGRPQPNHQGNSPLAAARSQKVALSNTLPPNAATIGQRGDARIDGLSEADILAMPAHDLESLTPAQLAQFMR